MNLNASSHLLYRSLNVVIDELLMSMKMIEWAVVVVSAIVFVLVAAAVVVVVVLASVFHDLKIFLEH